MSVRLSAALVAGKSAAVAARSIGAGGTSLPGAVARKVHTGVLAELTGRRGVPVVAVTGSNGKTTTCRLLSALLAGEGVQISQNRAGSNLARGVTALAVSAADLRGRIRSEVIVAEVDEGALVEVAAQTLPRVLVVTNLFRDQLDRFGEIHAVARALDQVASELRAGSTVVVNGDDPVVARMAQASGAKRVTYGLALDQSTDSLTSAADSIRCPACQTDLVYHHIYLGHLGSYECPACGLSRPRLDIAVVDVQLKGLQETRCTLRTPDGELIVRIPQAGIHTAYNAAAAIAATYALGVDVPNAVSSLAAVPAAFGRLEVIDAGSREVVLALAKNPASFNATLRTLAVVGEPRYLMLAASNTTVDGEDFGWLWDVDIESVVSGLETVTLAGLRADELATRVKYAGLSDARVTTRADPASALDCALDTVPEGDRLCVIAGYTPTIEIREAMRKRGWVGRFWRS